jgi:LCP family protein required for cell wall assembly
VHARRVRPSGPETHAVRRPKRPQTVPTRRRTHHGAIRDVGYFAQDDLRRIMASFGSAIVPGLGQLLNGRRRLAQWFALPALLVAAIVILVVATRSPARLFASMVSPTVMGTLLSLNIVVLGWRTASVVHAFFDGRYPGRSGRAGAAGLALVLVAVAVPHVIANSWGNTAQAAFAQIFTGDRADGPGQPVAAVEHGPGHDERLNILVVGIDKTPQRTATLTDSMMVASIDPVGETVTLVSLPRDLVRVPLGAGNVFGPKLNSLMAYADRHPETFPKGGMRALEDAVGALLGIEIHYYAQIDFFGFVKLVDAVGGVDVNVTNGFYDETYDGIGVNPEGILGWGVEVGPNHFNGWEALAYSRARKADGQSDFTRAARQQEILLALRDKIMSDGSLLTNLPALITAFGDLVKTDLPTDRLPDLAAIADEMDADALVRTVLMKPLVTSGGNDPVYGSIQVPDVAAILEVARTLFPPPGEMPQPWPTPDPTAVPTTAPAVEATAAP